MTRLAALGRVFFALAVAGSGILQASSGRFVRLVPELPAWFPRPAYWAVASGLLLMVAAAALLRREWARPAAVAVALLLLVSFAFRVPEIAADPWTGFRWTNPLKTLALAGGALLLGALFAAGDPVRGRAERWLWLAAGLFGVFLSVCGIQHFRYADFVDTLVPAWIPPGARAWTLFTGAALFFGGIGVMVPRVARLAAFWSGVMIFLWVLLLHIPRAWTMRSTFELAGVFEALAMSGIGFMLAGRRPLKEAAQGGARHEMAIALPAGPLRP